MGNVRELRDMLDEVMDRPDMPRYLHRNLVLLLDGLEEMAAVDEGAAEELAAAAIGEFRVGLRRMAVRVVN